jgi:hypothetical protein
MRPLAIHPSGRRHRWAILTTPGVGHKPASSAPEPTPATAQPGYLTAAAAESRNDIVVRTGTHSAVRAAYGVGRVPPPTARARNCDGGGAAEAGHSEYIVVVLCLAVCVVVWARSGRLGAARGKDRGCIAGPLTRPEAGRVVV